MFHFQAKYCNLNSSSTTRTIKSNRPLNVATQIGARSGTSHRIHDIQFIDCNVLTGSGSATLHACDAASRHGTCHILPSDVADLEQRGIAIACLAAERCALANVEDRVCNIGESKVAPDWF